MAKQIKFNVRLSLDGKEQLVSATANLKDLRRALGGARQGSERLKKSLLNFNQTVDAVRNVADAVGQLSGRLREYAAQAARAAQLTGLSGEALSDFRAEASAVASTFGEDVAGVMQAANSLSRAFGISASEALSLVRDGFVGGANAGGDFLSTLKEYPRYFKEAGLGAESFVALTANAAREGIFSDKGVDAIKEGNLRLREMTTATRTALEGIGLSADDVARRLEAGSASTFDIMREVSARLRELPPDAAAVGAALADIFGGPGEDAGLEYIKSLADVELSMDGVLAGADDVSRAMGRQAEASGRLRAALSGVADAATGLYARLAPALDVGAQIGMTLSGVAALTGAFKALNVQAALHAARSAAAGAASLILTGRLGAAGAAVRVLSGALRTGAFSATAFKVALRGLLTATGVGLAITAVTMAVEHFTAAADRAKDAAAEAGEATDSLADATGEYRRAAAEAKAALDEELRSLGDLVRQGGDASAAVARLNDRYGEALGVHRTAAEWYDVLTRKSRDYVRQIGYEAQARLLASRLAEKQIQLESNFERRRELWNRGEAQTGQYVLNLATGKGETMQVDTKAYAELKQEARRLIPTLGELERQLRLAQQGAERAAASVGRPAAKDKTSVVPEIPEPASGNPEPASGNPEPASVNQAPSGLIASLEQQLDDLQARLGAATSEAAVSALNREIADVEAELERLRSLGREAGEAVAEGVTEGARAVDETASTLAGCEENVRILNERLQTATMEQAAELNRQKKLWEDRAEAFRTAGVEVAEESQRVGETLEKGWGGLKGVGSAVEGLTRSLQGNASAWQTVTGLVDGFVSLYENLKGVGDILQTLTGLSLAHAGAKAGEAAAEGTASAARATSEATDAATSAAVVTANKLETASWKELAAAKYMAAHAEIPFTGFGIAAGFVAAMEAMVSAAGIPALAEGGLATGPTLALVGEYAGAAAGNPEVIAPLDRLRSLIAPAGGGWPERLEFEIKGRTLSAILEKEYNRTRRS